MPCRLRRRRKRFAVRHGRIRHQPKHGGRKRPRIEGPGNVTLKRLGYNVAWDPTTDIMVDVLKETTGYDVEYYALPAENADEKLVMEVAGGASYDIIQCSPDQFQTLMSQGALMPLNDLLDVYGQDILNGVSEDSWRAVSGEDGNIYGIPYKYPYAQEVQGLYGMPLGSDAGGRHRGHPNHDRRIL